MKEELFACYKGWWWCAGKASTLWHGLVNTKCLHVGALARVCVREREISAWVDGLICKPENRTERGPGNCTGTLLPGWFTKGKSLSPRAAAAAASSTNQVSNNFSVPVTTWKRLPFSASAGLCHIRADVVVDAFPAGFGFWWVGQAYRANIGCYQNHNFLHHWHGKVSESTIPRTWNTSLLSPVSWGLWLEPRGTTTLLIIWSGSKADMQTTSEVGRKFRSSPF